MIKTSINSRIFSNFLEKSVNKNVLLKNSDLDSIDDEIQQMIYEILPPRCVEQLWRRRFLPKRSLDHDLGGFLDGVTLEPYFPLSLSQPSARTSLPLSPSCQNPKMTWLDHFTPHFLINYMLSHVTHNTYIHILIFLN